MISLPRAHEWSVLSCHGCGLVCEDVSRRDPRARCPRCGASLYRRRKDAIPRAWAFLIAAMIFYIPANVLPVMHTGFLGRSYDSTIMSGVVQFWNGGSYGVALIIFVASVVVPCTKFLIMGLLLLTCQRRVRWARLERARLYRLVELVGYWSMLDVLVVAVVSALVQFQSLSTVEPRLGILFFGMVVVLTMLSAMCFDPRLIWDDRKDDG
ncbi:paraquat-inducible protein A [Marinimicrobium sp. ARAG 43.8]|uniref:paraquat-inducible protein A n=1 Tax=Marinimicrobium sp. ARAG 43.8 TaxID=3418719 RepID=UPI003CF67CC9